MISSVLFCVLLIGSIVFFIYNARKIRRNIFIGKDLEISDNKAERWKTMIRVALGQSKMVTRPLSGFMHILVYVGFVLINIEVLEMLVDGVINGHRSFSF
ncbi:MAG: Fe-S oxidoreductase, partial [Bacteroidia bacterium]